MGQIFLNYFLELEDPRIDKMVTHPLEELLLTTLCAVLCGANDWVIVAAYGKTKLEYLRQFLPYKNGSASHDTFSKVFSVLDSKKFSDCFLHWTQSLLSKVEGIVAIDGKTVRRSHDKSNDKRAIHVISAFATAQNLVIAQNKTAEKSNEITMIPELLDRLVLAGAIVTIDAMGCQRKICQKIIDQKADYVIGLKGNQATLKEDVENIFTEQYASNFQQTSVKIISDISNKKSHGRTEERQYYILDDIEPLQKIHQWPGLASIIMVKAKRTINAKTTEETRFYISSIDSCKIINDKQEMSDKIDKIPVAIRTHWKIENTLHWSLDVTFADDLSRARTKNLAFNFSIIKHIAFNILKKNLLKSSLNVKRHKAGWDNDFLTQLLIGTNKDLSQNVQ